MSYVWIIYFPKVNQHRERCFFRLVTSVRQIKNSDPHEESNLRPSDLRSDALPLSHRDSTVSEVYYEDTRPLYC